MGQFVRQHQCHVPLGKNNGAVIEPTDIELWFDPGWHMGGADYVGETSICLPMATLWLAVRFNARDGAGPCGCSGLCCFQLRASRSCSWRARRARVTPRAVAVRAG